MSSNIEADGAQDDIIYPSALPFLSVHLACIAAIWSGVTLQAVALCVVLYWLRIFAIGAGYHRYFSHRAYSTSRAFQFHSPSFPRRARKKAFCGGLSNIASITCTPIRCKMSIRRDVTASFTAIWDGFSRANKAPPISRKSRI